MQYYYLFVHVLVNQIEFQFLDQRDGKIKGNVHPLSDLHIALLDSMKGESESPREFRTRVRSSPEVQP